MQLSAEQQEKARDTAASVRSFNELAPEPERFLDGKNNGAAAWSIIVNEEKQSGVVVYEDDPECVVSVTWTPGRWRPA